MRRILSLVMVLSLIFTMPVYGASKWDKDSVAGDISVSDIDAYENANMEALDRVLSNLQENCRLAYSSATTVTVAVGQVTCSNTAGTLRQMRSNTSATSVTFSNIDTGSEAAGTWYVYAVADADAGAFTVMVSLSATAPTGATYYKRIGSFVNDSSLDITESSITNDGDYFGLSIGSWETKTNATVYQAPADGFVVAYAYWGSGDLDAYIYTDSSNPPTTWRCQSNGFAYESQPHEDTMTCPVKKGDYWKTVACTTVYWIEFTK